MPSALKINYFAHEAEQLNYPPVILIHGAGGNHLSWPPQIRRLPEKRVFAIDLPGHGKSEGAGRHSIDEYVEDLISFIESLDIHKALLVGVSMGGAIALAFALKYPNKVQGLALLGTGAKMRVAPEILEALGNSNMFEAIVNEISKNCFSENAPQNFIQLSAQAMLQMNPPALLGDFMACDQFDITAQLKKIKTPVLIICGSEDKMTPLKYSVSLKDKIVNSRLEIVNGAGHMVMTEQPDIVAGLLAQFIDALPLRPGS